MLIITAPAKTLDLTSDYPPGQTTQPLFLVKAECISSVLKKRSVRQLKKLMGISDKIAEENYVRFQKWQKDPAPMTSRPAIFMYDGDIYQEIFPRAWNQDQAAYAQNSVRIISGLYGMVRPFDNIQPYRLEMKAKLRIGKARNLYDFWQQTITDELNKEIKEQGHSYLLNIASDESSDAIELKKLNCEVIKVFFKETIDGEAKVVPIYSKHARGMMVEFCVKNKIEDLRKLEKFTTAGYKFDTIRDSTITFVRG